MGRLQLNYDNVIFYGVKHFIGIICAVSIWIIFLDFQ